MKTDKLRELLAEVESLENTYGYVRVELTADLCEACGYEVYRGHRRFVLGVRSPGIRHWRKAPRALRSVDDASQLIQDTLPGWSYSLVSEGAAGCRAQIWIDRWSPGALGRAGRHAEPAIALAIALIRALIYRQESHHDRRLHRDVPGSGEVLGPPIELSDDVNSLL